MKILIKKPSWKNNGKSFSGNITYNLYLSCDLKFPTANNVCVLECTVCLIVADASLQYAWFDERHLPSE